MAGFIETDDGSVLSDMEAVRVQYERMIALDRKSIISCGRKWSWTNVGRILAFICWGGGKAEKSQRV
jgi:hypothetical protein